MVQGSEAHKALFCQTFVGTHRKFEPEDLPWPELDATTIGRLRSIPFWDAALRAERNAGIMVSGFAETLSDPLIRQAMAVQGVEEARHARLLEVMLKRYDIACEALPSGRVATTENAFIGFGYEECIDSFFGFGIFGLARQIQLFVPELTDIFEYVLLEEARHVTFFVNWIAYLRINSGRGALPLQAILTAYGYLRAVKRIATTFAPSAKSGTKMKGVAFGAEGAFTVFKGVTWRAFLQSCINENNRYLGAMPRDLLRPRVLPTLARWALSLPSFSRRRTAPARG